jgi:hypothetical protein
LSGTPALASAQSSGNSACWDYRGSAGSPA